jgi:50S ribosomal protein L16 3-hydroxylase
MDIDAPTPLLGGLSPAVFMRRHWQKKPLLVRSTGAGAVPGFDRRRLFGLAAEDGVESRLIVRAGERWSVRHGPLPRRALPPMTQAGWTLLVQGVDLHDDAARALLDRFAFTPAARLDDLMLSWASDGGGVGPHLDSYDVFLLQLEGRRRWRIGPVPRPRLRDDVPLRMLDGFVPAEEMLLEPGDMLYLPPRWGHDGIAEGACITASIGFRAPAAEALAAELVQRVAENAIDDAGDGSDGRIYVDRGQPATPAPGRIPDALQDFADDAVDRLLADARQRRRALGELLSEPKPGTWFEGGAALAAASGVVLDRRTRMLYDAEHVFINGEAYRAGGRDATLMHALADTRALDAESVRRLGTAARALLVHWVEAGWCRSSRPNARRSR